MPRARLSPLALRAPAAASALLAAALLPACGAGPFEGEFQGTCAVGDGTDAFTLPIEFTVVEGDEGELVGFGAFRFNREKVKERVRNV